MKIKVKDEIARESIKNANMRIFKLEKRVEILEQGTKIQKTPKDKMVKLRPPASSRARADVAEVT